MKILHVIPDMSPLSGGPVHAAFGMARAVARLGHEVAIFTTKRNGPDDLDVPTDRPVVRDGVAIHYFPVQAPRFWRLSLPFARAFKQAVAGYDVVHEHALYLFQNVVTDHYCRRLGVPFILRPLGTLDSYIYHRHRWRKAVMETLFQNRLMRDASALHYTTKEEMRLAAPYARGVPGAVVPLGLDPADYDPPSPPGSFRARHPEIGDRTIILFFGLAPWSRICVKLMITTGNHCMMISQRRFKVEFAGAQGAVSRRAWRRLPPCRWG